jgi:hypothetical protein
MGESIIGQEAEIERLLLGLLANRNLLISSSIASGKNGSRERHTRFPARRGARGAQSHDGPPNPVGGRIAAV